MMSAYSTKPWPSSSRRKRITFLVLPSFVTSTSRPFAPLLRSAEQR